MFVRNTTPFLCGTKPSALRNPQIVMTAVVRGKFAIRPDEVVTVLEGDLDQGLLTDEMFDEDDENRTGASSYGGDFADIKPHGEVLFSGHCHTPNEQPLRECPVVLAIGTVRKTLRVVGERTYKQTTPEPFTKMPITYAHAFGGSGQNANPVGKGVRTDGLPNIELPQDVVGSWDERSGPTGFGPISSYWPVRAARRGKAYGKGYVAPFWAADFDPRFFQAAPPDQWIEGAFRGDEELFLQNLHPAYPLLRTKLPGLRIRAIVKDSRGVFTDATLTLDTVYVTPDEDTITLTWRAVFPVREDDLADVKTMYVWSEPLEGPAKPLDEARAALEAFERDPVGLSERMPPAMLELAERRKREADGEVFPEDPEAAALDPVSRYVRRRLGNVASDKQAQVVAMLAPSMEKPEVRAKAAEVTAQLEAQAQNHPPVPATGKPGVAPNTGFRRTMRLVLEEARRLRDVAQRADIPADKRGELLEKVAHLERMAHHPRWVEMDPTYIPPVDPLSNDEPGPGKNLEDHDLTGRDLSGMDLSKANLRGAILTRANLSGANLQGADLTNAILFRTILDGASLEKATLLRVNAARVSALHTNFRQANLEQAYFANACLTGANFEETKGEFAVFQAANLGGAVFRGAELAYGDFAEAVLDETNLSGAKFLACMFVDASGTKLNARGGSWNRCSFERAKLPGAVFVDATGERVNFSHAQLDGADFGYGVFVRAQFTEATAQDGSFYGANLLECRFYRANLIRCDFQFANLKGADLGKAVLDQVNFRYASLYEAVLLGSKGTGVDFLNANLRRSTLEKT